MPLTNNVKVVIVWSPFKNWMFLSVCQTKDVRTISNVDLIFLFLLRVRKIQVPVISYFSSWNCYCYCQLNYFLDPEKLKTNYINSLLFTPVFHLQDQFSPPENFSTSPLGFLYRDLTKTLLSINKHHWATNRKESKNLKCFDLARTTVAKMRVICLDIII